jgi:hypothetical protein
MKLNTGLTATAIGFSCTAYVACTINISFASSKILVSSPPNTILIAALDCKEWKKRNGDTGKAAASDAPSWVKNEGHKPCKNPNEDGKAFARRLLDGKYGPGNYAVGADSEYSKIQKYGDRSFE